MKEEILYILTYFVIYSFLGWLLESIFKSILEKKIVNSGFMHGPFCPIYGVGAIIMYLALKDFKANIFLVFIIGFVVLSIWEYIVGWGLEKLFKTKYWDYSQNRFNIKGRVCLMNSFFWGGLSVAFIYVIHPFLEGQIKMLPHNILWYLNILIYAYLITDFTISIIKAKKLDVKLEHLKELGETLKEKIASLEELKQVAEHKQNGLESLQNIIDDLKLKQDRLRRKLYRQTYRLKKAFPTMRSESITEFLNQKIDGIKNKQKEK